MNTQSENSEIPKKFTAKELAKMKLPGFPQTKMGFMKKASKEGWPFSNRSARGGGREYIFNTLPKNLKIAIIKKNPNLFGTMITLDSAPPVIPGTPQNGDSDSLWSYYASRPEKEKKIAEKRLLALNQVFDLKSNDISKMDSILLVAEEIKVSQSSIYNWFGAVKDFDRSNWLPALMPKWKGCQIKAECSIEAWKLFGDDYLRPEKPSIAACYRRLKRIARGKNWKIPSLKYFMRRRLRELSREEITLAREGKKALDQMYPAQERDKSGLHALECVNADGHKFDVFIKWPDGNIVRPVGIFFQDIYSGKILSSRVDPTENKDLIRLSFADMVENYGIPKEIFLDNSRSFASKWLTGGTKNRYRFKIKPEDPTGIMVYLGCKIHWTIPYRGQSKPIERAFRDFVENISKHPAFAGAYTGSNPNAKPGNYGSKAIDLKIFMEVLDSEIKAHNAQEGRRSPVCNGLSFNAVFNESYARVKISKITEEQRGLLLLPVERARTARYDGSIALAGNRYWDEKLSSYSGQELFVRLDPQDLHVGIFVYNKDNRFICTANCIDPVGFKDSQAAKEHARCKRQFIKTTKLQLESKRRMDASRAAAMLPQGEAAEIPSSKVVKGFFKENIKAKKEQKEADDLNFEKAMQQATFDDLEEIRHKFPNRSQEFKASQF